MTRSLPGISALPLDLALLVLDRQAAGDGRAAEDDMAGSATAETATESPCLREPADLEQALENADQEAQRLRGENAATVVILRWTSLMLGIGIVVLAAGVVVLLADAPIPSSL